MIPACPSASCAAKASARPTISIFSTRGGRSSREREARIAPYDALVLPTTANTPPRIADLADDKAFATQNLRALRNCTLINMLDGCAISLPAHREGEVPVGLMLAAPADRIAASSNWRPEWRTSSVLDLTFTVEDKGAPTPLDARDQPGRHRRLDRPRSRGARQAHCRAGSDRHRAAGIDADLLPRSRASRITMADRIEVSRRRFQRRGRVRADRLAGPHLRRLRLRSYRPQGGSLQRHGVQADVRQADRVRTVETRRRHRPLGPDDPALLGRDRRHTRACTRKARSMACCR